MYVNNREFSTLLAAFLCFLSANFINFFVCNLRAQRPVPHAYEYDNISSRSNTWYSWIQLDHRQWEKRKQLTRNWWNEFLFQSGNFPGLKNTIWDSTRSQHNSSPPVLEKNSKWVGGDSSQNFETPYLGREWSTKCKIESTIQRKSRAIHRHHLRRKFERGIEPETGFRKGWSTVQRHHFRGEIWKVGWNQNCETPYLGRGEAQNVKWEA